MSAKRKEAPAGDNLEDEEADRTRDLALVLHHAIDITLDLAADPRKEAEERTVEARKEAEAETDQDLLQAHAPSRKEFL